MKKYFRIISKLIEKHGKDKRVLKYIIKMNNYILSNLNQYGGNPSKELETIGEIINEMGDILNDSIKRLFEQGYNIQDITNLLKSINEKLTKII